MTGQVKTSEVKLGQIKSGWDRYSQVRTGQVWLRQVKLSWDRSSQVETCQFKLGKVKSVRSIRKLFVPKIFGPKFFKTINCDSNFFWKQIFWAQSFRI